MCCLDPAWPATQLALNVMRDAYDPAGPCPPDAGGSTVVRFLAGDNSALPPVNPDSEECNPFLWVRAVRRYRTLEFPQPSLVGLKGSNCGLSRVLVLELGVIRCVKLSLQMDWDAYETMSEHAMDDSHRIEQSLCELGTRLGDTDEYDDKGYTTDTIAAYGPDGGIIAWTGVAYIEF